MVSGVRALGPWVRPKRAVSTLWIMVSRRPEASVYRQTAAAIRARIAAGEWAPGDYLPSEPFLAHEYGIGRDSLRRSLALLRSEGLIRTPIPGQRWTVAPEPELRELWIRTRTRVTFRQPTDAERTDWNLPDGVVLAELHQRGVAVRVVRSDEYELWFE